MAPSAEVKVPDEAAMAELVKVFTDLNADGSGLKAAMAKVAAIKIEAGSFTEATALESQVAARVTALTTALGNVSKKLDEIAGNLRNGAARYQSAESTSTSEARFFNV